MQKLGKEILDTKIIFYTVNYQFLSFIKLYFLVFNFTIILLFGNFYLIFTLICFQNLKHTFITHYPILVTCSYKY